MSSTLLTIDGTKMFTTHFGDTFNGGTIWWDNTSDSNKLTATVFLNMHANMLIIDSPQASHKCTTDNNFLICTTSTYGTPVTDPSKFFFGIYWANPGYSATAPYDGFYTIADFSVTTPSNIASATPDYLTVNSKVSALVTGANQPDISPTKVGDVGTTTSIDTISLSAANDVTTGKVTGDELCTEWWYLDAPRIACVSW